VASAKTDTMLNPPDAARADLRLLSVELDGWPPVGPDKIRLDLADRRTILVGRNGAGKSALIDGILLGISDSLRGPRIGPREFRARFGTADGRLINYEHSWEPAPKEGSLASELPEGQQRQKWSERCWYEGKEKEPLWQMKDGIAEVAGGVISVPEESSVPMTVVSKSTAPYPGDTAILVFTFFCSFARRVDAGIPHAKEPRGGPQKRTDFALFYKNNKEADSPEGQTPGWRLLGKMPKRFTQVFSTIFEWWQTDSETERFTELKELGEKIGAFQSLEVTPSDLADQTSIALMTVDGQNVGAAPDGTLRMIEILQAMLTIGSSSILLLEEPETGVHPAALVSLLNVLDSYAVDRQFLISSHSPVVMKQARPEELRIVFRHEGRTHVRPLDNSELERAAAFLSQEGTLDEFLGSGAIDEA
jgi:predicted ATPase